MSAGAYSFLSFARVGLANRIAAVDRDPNVRLRPSIDVQLELVARRLDGTNDPRPIGKTVALYGPGDLLGVERRAILRTEPGDWTTNFEPNYLAAIEFYDEDFPWRYTPAAPDASGQLRPWLALLVLADGEFTQPPNDPDRPLPFVSVASARHAELFPPADDGWAWAHVHVNRTLGANEQEIVATDRAAVASRLQTVLAEDPDLAYSRIVCPRRLQPKTSYTAFLVPTFETGRLAGLKLAQAAPFATASSWGAYTGRVESDNFPYYHRWYFRTGEIGDFESLVRLLEPKAVDPRVGTRDMDVQEPGHALPGIADPALKGVLALGGALKIPAGSLSPADREAADRQENWATPYPHRFQQQLASFINLSDDYETRPPAQANAASSLDSVNTDPDPLITPPLYGCWHAISSRLLVDRQGAALANDRNWIHELNLDPRYRVPAGFGTRVIQKEQENLMTAAWQQVGDILEANQRIRRFQMSRRVAFAWHETDLRPLATASAARSLSVTAPVHARIAAARLNSSEPGARALNDEKLSLKGLIARSAVPPVLLSPALRRAVRPGGRLVRSLPFTEAARPGDLIDRVNRGDVLPAPRKETPAGVVTDAAVIDSLAAPAVPRWLVAIVRRMPWIAWVPLLILILVALLLLRAGASWAIAGAWIALGAVASAWLQRLAQSIRRADALDNVDRPPSAVDAVPARSSFVVGVPGVAAPPPLAGGGGGDSQDAARFRSALKELRAVVQGSRAADKVGENGPTGPSLVLGDQADAALAALQPSVTISRRAKDTIGLPPRIARELDDDLVEAKAYPVIDRPMYRPLAELSSEMLLPNINRLENNSLSLLETNQKFIEAYMVGLNHEFSRELLWREFPTDQRGSCFRQFWDVSGVLSEAAAADEAALREQLRDIPPLDRWRRDSRLGEHDARPAAGGAAVKVVLVLRGELLKRYPTAVVYAQRAEWGRRGDGSIDRERERTLVTLTAQEEDQPPRAKLRTPLYEAKVEPDIYFFGFDLTVAEARGGSGDHAADPAGWFFVLKERPGEPRFGFDEKSASPLVVWNDLGWDRVAMSGQFISPTGGTPPVIPQTTPAGQGEKELQRVDDVRVRWDGAAGAAELAYIMYQAPVLVAVHAAEMLPA
jgi:hypothetical protein